MILDYYRLFRFFLTGRKPWSPGYEIYKEISILKVLKSKKMLAAFAENQELPKGYGSRSDERIVEYPWIFSRLQKNSCILLDAGSALNFKFLLQLSPLQDRTIIEYNLNCESPARKERTFYSKGDLRYTALKDNSIDEIACISTLEHIGMDNTLLYSKDRRLKENKPDDYRKVINEFKRILKSGGSLFITVPFGRYANLGWLQQFDGQMIDTIVEVFKGSLSKISFFKYFKDGWQVADRQACTECLYFDINSRKDYEPDYVAAARAVACIELIK